MAPKLAPIIKSPNFQRKNSGENSIQIAHNLTAELASHKMLLHDATQALHLNSVTRKKYNKKIFTLTILTILLTNLLSVTVTGSITYFYTTTQAGPGIQAVPGIEAAPGIESMQGIEDMQKMEAVPGVRGDFTGGMEAGGRDPVHVSVTGTTLGKNQTKSQTYLGSIWN